METGGMFGLCDHLSSCMTWRCLETSGILSLSLVSAQYLVYIRAHRPHTRKNNANYLVYSNMLAACGNHGRNNKKHPISPLVTITEKAPAPESATWVCNLTAFAGLNFGFSSISQITKEPKIQRWELIRVTENSMGGTISLSEVSHVHKAVDGIRDIGYKSNLIW